MPTLRNRKVGATDADDAAAEQPASGGWSTADEPAKGPAFVPSSSSTQYNTTQSEI